MFYSQKLMFMGGTYKSQVGIDLRYSLFFVNILFHCLIRQYLQRGENAMISPFSISLGFLAISTHIHLDILPFFFLPIKTGQLEPVEYNSRSTRTKYTEKEQTNRKLNTFIVWEFILYNLYLLCGHYVLRNNLDKTSFFPFRYDV